MRGKSRSHVASMRSSQKSRRDATRKASLRLIRFGLVIAPACGGTWNGSRPTAGTRAYPRRRGGNVRSQPTGVLAEGLSPQARGELGPTPSSPRRPGPIPAGAGGTHGVILSGYSDRAYPRRRGGNARHAGRVHCRLGLSPQARGERHELDTQQDSAGPIPAGAGGTTLVHGARSFAGAYPRRRGGNGILKLGEPLFQGLSPQARGERTGRFRAGARPGPIPAGAGGTWPPPPGGPRPWAYPRRRGGNVLGGFALVLAQGLSPQARGEHARRRRESVQRGPIPAGAGGTRPPAAPCPWSWAYPRRRGGNGARGICIRRRKGLSPQARGELDRRVQARQDDGPIPAGAGGTITLDTHGEAWTAYPRRRGGNPGASFEKQTVAGLSPQARGELQMLRMVSSVRGPIPAGAGGTQGPRP